MFKDLHCCCNIFYIVNITNYFIIKFFIVTSFNFTDGTIAMSAGDIESSDNDPIATDNLQLGFDQ